MFNRPIIYCILAIYITIIILDGILFNRYRMDLSKKEIKKKNIDLNSIKLIKIVNVLNWINLILLIYFIIELVIFWV